MGVDVRDFHQEKFWDEMEQEYTKLSEEVLQTIASCISGFPCKDFSRLNIHQMSNRGNAQSGAGTSGSAFAGVVAFLSKWIAANLQLLIINCLPHSVHPISLGCTETPMSAQRKWLRAKPGIKITGQAQHQNHRPSPASKSQAKPGIRITGPEHYNCSN